MSPIVYYITWSFIEWNFMKLPYGNPADTQPGTSEI